MPRDKDLKRLTRRRMEKTGESYTAARANLISRQTRQDGAPDEAPPRAATGPTYAELAGMSDEVVAAKTGRDWRGWVEALDAIAAATKPHREIAAHVHEAYAISGWWSQSVTVGYERIKGLREIGQRRDGDFEASKSKTVAGSVDEARRAFSDPDLRARWLPDAKPTLRKTTSPHGLRFTWEDDTVVAVWFAAKGEAKTQVTVTHGKLASRQQVDEKKRYWGARLEALAESLKPTR